MSSLRSVLAGAAFGAAFLAPLVASAQAAATTPAAPPKVTTEVVERYPPTSARWKILLAGIALTGIGYGGAALMGGLWDGIPGGDYLFIPVAGPWISLSQTGCTPSEEAPAEGTTELQECAGMQGLRGVIYVVDALVQLGGLGILGESIFMTTESPDAAQKATILPMPIITEHTVGIGVMGRF